MHLNVYLRIIIGEAINDYLMRGNVKDQFFISDLLNQTISSLYFNCNNKHVESIAVLYIIFRFLLQNLETKVSNFHNRNWNFLYGGNANRHAHKRLYCSSM